MLAETREADPMARAELQARAHEVVDRHGGHAAGRDRAGPAAHGAQNLKRQDPTQRGQGALPQPRTDRPGAAGVVVAIASSFTGRAVGAQLGGSRALLRENALCSLVVAVLVAVSFVLRVFAVIVACGSALAVGGRARDRPRRTWRRSGCRSRSAASIAFRRADAMLVFNHSSYMDALVLGAIFPASRLSS